MSEQARKTSVVEYKWYVLSATLLTPLLYLHFSLLSDRIVTAVVWSALLFSSSCRILLHLLGLVAFCLVVS